MPHYVDGKFRTPPTNGRIAFSVNGRQDMENSNDLRGKVVVVTGASSGFGKGIALKFAMAGCKVALAARRSEQIAELKAEIQMSGGKAIAVQTDVSERSQVENLAQRVTAELGGIDIWVNNAGVGAIGRFAEIPLEDHEKVIRTNLLGTIYGSYCAWKQFFVQGRGTLINIASELGKMPAPLYSTYTASKYGVVGFSAALRQEILEANLADVHVCTVMPSATDTFFFDHAANYTGRETVPIPPLYDPQDVIDTVFNLATNPKDEVIVATKTKVMNALHKVMPETIEKMTEKQVEKEQLEKAPAAAPGPRNLHEPSPEGHEVSAGRLNK